MAPARLDVTSPLALVTGARPRLVDGAQAGCRHVEILNWASAARPAAVPVRAIHKVCQFDLFASAAPTPPSPRPPFVGGGGVPLATRVMIGRPPGTHRQRHVQRTQPKCGWIPSTMDYASPPGVSFPLVPPPPSRAGRMLRTNQRAETMPTGLRRRHPRQRPPLPYRWPRCRGERAPSSPPPLHNWAPPVLGAATRLARSASSTPLPRPSGRVCGTLASPPRAGSGTAVPTARLYGGRTDALRRAWHGGHPPCPPPPLAPPPLTLHLAH